MEEQPSQPSQDSQSSDSSQSSILKGDHARLEHLADVFQILSHETRLRILLAVAAADSITMTVLADTIGLTVPRTSELVTQLERGGFCTKTKLANYVTISLDFKAPVLINDFLSGLKRLYERNQQP